MRTRHSDVRRLMSWAACGLLWGGLGCSSGVEPEGPPPEPEPTPVVGTLPADEHRGRIREHAAPFQRGPAGLRVYVDPQTGRFMSPPPDAAPAEETLAESGVQSAEGLVVTPGPMGGDVVDLQGRFQSTVTATLQPDGTVRLRCGEGESLNAQGECVDEPATSKRRE